VSVVVRAGAVEYAKDETGREPDRSP